MSLFRDFLERGLFAYLLDLANSVVLGHQLFSTLRRAILAAEHLVAYARNENLVFSGLALCIAAAFATLLNRLLGGGSAASFLALCRHLHLAGHL